MQQTLVARRTLFYRHRAFESGQVFQASPIDAQYLISRGQADPLPVSDVIKAAAADPMPALVVAVVPTLLPDAEVKEPEAPVAEPAAEAVAESTEGSTDVSVETSDPIPARRPYTRRRTTPTE